MTNETTIAVTTETRDDLKELREYPRESLDSVVSRLISQARGDTETDTPELMDELRRIDGRLDELPEETARKTQERLR